MPVVTIQLTIPDGPGYLEDYTRIKVYRSTTGRTGTYAEITTEEDLPASVVGSLIGPFNVAGKTLLINYCQTVEDYSVTFPAGMTACSSSEVATYMAASVESRYLIFSSTTGHFGVETVGQGAHFNIQVAGTARAVLGLSANRAFGSGARVPIYPTIRKYQFRDWTGDTSYWYKYSLYNHLTLSETDKYGPIPGGNVRVVSDAAMSEAYGTLVGLDGVPYSLKRVRFCFLGPEAISVGTPPAEVYWFFPNQELTTQTDYTGHFSTYLPRGANVRVSIEGSKITRTITVPDEDDFDVLQLVADAPDQFQVHEPDVIVLPRRS